MSSNEKKARKLLKGYYDTRIEPGDPLILDWYHVMMSIAYVGMGRIEEKGVYYQTMRKIPDDIGSSYFLMCGTNFMLNHLAQLKFEDEDIRILSEMADENGVKVPEEFFEYLENFEFKADVYVIPEGELSFPGEPNVIVKGTLIEALIVESLIISQLTGMTLGATKTSVLVEAAQGIPVHEFGLRRSLYPMYTTWAALVGGCAKTSFVRAAAIYGAEISGTMAHAFVLAFDNELEAFYWFWRVTGSKVFLIDTYNTIQGAKNAITIAKIIGEKVMVRLDSGDLIKLSKEIEALDTEDWIEGIILTDDLNTERIREIKKADLKKLAGFGVGTYLVTIPSASSVYKLTAVDAGKGYKARVKISEIMEKSTLPGDFITWRKMEDGKYIGDIVALVSEGSPGPDFVEVMVLAMKDGKLTVDLPKLADIQQFARTNLSTLPDIYKGEDHAVYPVVFSDELLALKKKTIEESVGRQEKDRNDVLDDIMRMETERKIEQNIGGR